MIGHILDNRYKILEKVGTGGMASVYKARDILLDRIVAVKILDSKYSKDRDFCCSLPPGSTGCGQTVSP